MRPPFAVLALFALATLGTAAPAMSAPPEVAAIEATAPLSDPSEESVQAAIVTAVQKAARGALAMGLPWLRVKGAYVRAGYVGVHVIAMKEPGEDEREFGTDEERRPDAEPPDGGRTAPIRL